MVFFRVDSVVFVHHDSALSIASLRDCGILPMRCAACLILCFFVCFDVLPCLISIFCMLLFIGDVQQVHTVPWYRHVFRRSCVHVHMFTFVVFTLGRLACFGFIELQCISSPPCFYIVCELRVSGVCEDFSLLLCNNVCAC